MSVAAKKPVAAPAAAAVGVVAALAVMALGGVAVREALVAGGAVRGTPWLGWVFGKAEVLKPADWMTYAGAAAVLVGIVILVAALKPRRSTHLAVGEAGGGVWIRSRDAARLAADTARGIDSVTSASTAAKRRTLRVTATATCAPDRVRDDLATAIAQRLEPITPTPRVRARVVVEED